MTPFRFRCGQWGASAPALWRILALVLFASCGLAPQAVAAPLALKLATPSEFSEKIIHQRLGSQSVGNLTSLGLVGVMYARSGRLDFSAIHVDLSAASSDKVYCLRLNTRDAMYWALNRYVRVSGSGAVEMRSVYQDELKINYSADDFLARLTTGLDCSDQNATKVIPIGIGQVPVSAALLVYVNSPGDRVSVALVDAKGATIAKAACSTDDAQGAVAFTQSCRFDPAQIGGTSKLWLSMRRIGDNVESRVEIALPGHTQ